MRFGLLALLVALLALAPLASARADIYSYTDSSGVVHLTNIRPSGAKARRYKRVLDEDSVGKAAASRGRCPRCDVVPAKDSSSERFSRFDPFIYEAARLYAIPVPLIRAVIKVESDYDPRVVSSMGARGLMQLMPSVIKDMGVSDPHDPRENILGGTRLLRILANRYEGDLVKVIAAYHAGVGSLARYGDQVPPYPRTRRYLGMVMDRYRAYRQAQTQTSPVR